MPRIVGIDVPKDKRIDVALTYIYGIGDTMARRIMAGTNIEPSKRAKDLTDAEIGLISQKVQATTKVEGDLRREMSGNIKRLIDIGSYRGLRHKKGLPVRGQQTRTNARGRKGPRPRVGVRKKTRTTGPTTPGARPSA